MRYRSANEVGESLSFEGPWKHTISSNIPTSVMRTHRVAAECRRGQGVVDAIYGRDGFHSFGAAVWRWTDMDQPLPRVSACTLLFSTMLLPQTSTYLAKAAAQTGLGRLQWREGSGGQVHEATHLHRKMCKSSTTQQA